MAGGGEKWVSGDPGLRTPGEGSCTRASSAHRSGCRLPAPRGGGIRAVGNCVLRRRLRDPIDGRCHGL